jgi:hypothetical protein
MAPYFVQMENPVRFGQLHMNPKILQSSCLGLFNHKELFYIKASILKFILSLPWHFYTQKSSARQCYSSRQRNTARR